MPSASIALYAQTTQKPVQVSRMHKVREIQVMIYAGPSPHAPRACSPPTTALSQVKTGMWAAAVARRATATVLTRRSTLAAPDLQYEAQNMTALGLGQVRVSPVTPAHRLHESFPSPARRHGPLHSLHPPLHLSIPTCLLSSPCDTVRPSFTQSHPAPHNVTCLGNN